MDDWDIPLTVEEIEKLAFMQIKAMSIAAGRGVI